jgi:hypothetical protein
MSTRRSILALWFDVGRSDVAVQMERGGGAALGITSGRIEHTLTGTSQRPLVLSPKRSGHD